MHLTYKQTQRRRLRLAQVAMALLIAALSTLGCGGEKPIIRLHAWESESHFLNNAIFKFVVENGYGYPVETVVQTTPVFKETLPRGEVDLTLEGWQQNISDWYKEHTEKGNIVNLGMNFEGGPQFFIIPRWVAEEFNIKTVFDMSDHWDLFKDPSDPSKGVFYNCVIGQQCTEINTVKLEAYGLTGYYNSVSPASLSALEAALARSQSNRRPVFGYHWAPTGLAGAYEWHVLEEPTYSEACWERVLAASADKNLRPVDEACGYPDFPIDKLAHSGLQEKAQEVMEMLRKMSVGLEPLNRTLAWANENNIRDWERAAIHYLLTYEDRWRSWVTPDAYEEIKEALAEANPRQ